MKYLATLLALSLVLLARAQDTLSLPDAIALGLANNYQIQIAQKRVEIAQNNNTLKATGAYPRITGGFNSGNQFLVINNPTSFLDGNTLAGLGITPTVDVSWTLFDNYKVRINAQRLAQLEEQSLGNSDLVIENTINAIVLAYYRAVIEQEKIGVFEEVLTLSRDRYAFAESKRELGVGNSYEVVQIKDAYLNDSINLMRQQDAHAAALRNLNLAMGVDAAGTTYYLSDTLTLSEQAYKYETLEQKMLANSRTLRNQMLNQQLLKTNTALQRSNQWYIPRVTMSTGLNEALTQNFLWRPAATDVLSAGGRQFTFYLNFSVSFNLYDAGASQRAIQNAMVEEQIGLLNIADQKRQLASQLYSQLAAYRDQMAIIRLNEEVINNAKANLDISEERYKRAVISSFDYRNVQLAYLRAALTRLESVYSLKVLETELTRLTGGFVTE